MVIQVLWEKLGARRLGVGAKLKMSIKSIKSEARADCRGIFFGKEGQSGSDDVGTRWLEVEEERADDGKGGQFIFVRYINFLLRLFCTGVDSHRSAPASSPPPPRPQVFCVSATARGLFHPRNF